MAYSYNPNAFNFVPMQDLEYKQKSEVKIPSMKTRAKEELKNYRDEKKFNPNKQLIQPQAPNLAEIALATIAGYTKTNPYQRDQAMQTRDPAPSIKDENPMVKARVIIDDQIVTAKIHKKDLEAGEYKLAPKKKTKLKQRILEARQKEGFCSDLSEDSPIYEEYIDYLPTNDLTEVTSHLLLKLKKFFYRQKNSASSHKPKKRFISGMKECCRNALRGYLIFRKVKAMIIAIDIERVPGEGGLDELLESLIYNCEYMNIPMIYSHKRQNLGRIIKNKALSLSCVGIMDYSGVEDSFNQMVNLSNELKEEYEKDSEDQFKMVYSNSQIYSYPEYSFIMRA